MSKVLIIKLGYSETLDPEIGNLPSLGDVMRTTVILHAFKDDHVTWLTDKTAYPLLKDNPYIDRILIYDLSSVLQLWGELYDTVVNFEKVPGICHLASMIKANEHYGFSFDMVKGETDAYKESRNAFEVYGDLESKKNASRYWQDVLYEMIGETWDYQDYVLGYKPKSVKEFDIGLNHLIGTKWPNKYWNGWESLHKSLEKRFKVSWQQGERDIIEYIEWLNKCHLIVTQDSLGLHLALALKKKVVALFGPTASQEVYLYDLGKIVQPRGSWTCLPCLKPVCSQRRRCLDTLEVKDVVEAIEESNG
jgi:heptosyltransferase-2